MRRCNVLMSTALCCALSVPVLAPTGVAEPRAPMAMSQQGAAGQVSNVWAARPAAELGRAPLRPALPAPLVSASVPAAGPAVPAAQLVQRPASRTVVPAPNSSGATAAAAPVNLRDTLTWVDGQESWLLIPSIGLQRRVFFGGQSVIDEGVITHFDGAGAGWLPAVAAGAPGTFWLAAHHVTHGAPFLRLPEVVQGATVIVITRTHTFTYQITGRVETGSSAAFSTVYGADPSASRLLLQTCLHNGRLLLAGALISAA